MKNKAKKPSPSDFLGNHLKSGLSGIPVNLLKKDTDKKIAYGCRFVPKDYDDLAAFHKGSAMAYEIYVICTKDGFIDDINHRIEQCPCGEGKSFAPKGAPTWMMPAEAMFDLDWDDIVPVAQERMLDLLKSMTESPKPPKKKPNGRKKSDR